MLFNNRKYLPGKKSTLKLLTIVFIICKNRGYDVRCIHD